MRRSKQQWLELIQAQQSSGVSIAEFCREHDLSLKYFYARRSDWLKSQSTKTDLQPSAFSKVTVAKTHIHNSNESISLTVGKATLSIPSSIDVIWLAKLMAQLA